MVLGWSPKTISSNPTPKNHLNIWCLFWGYPPPTNSEIIICSFLWRAPYKPSLSTVSGPGIPPKFILYFIWIVNPHGWTTFLSEFWGIQSCSLTPGFVLTSMTERFMNTSGPTGARVCGDDLGWTLTNMLFFSIDCWWKVMGIIGLINADMSHEQNWLVDLIKGLSFRQAFCLQIFPISQTKSWIESVV